MCTFFKPTSRVRFAPARPYILYTCLHYSVNDAMSLINRRTYFLLLCLFVFVNFTGFLWQQQRNKRYETNVYGNSVRELKLARRSVSPEGSDSPFAETNPIDFQTPGEGDNIEQTQVIRLSPRQDCLVV